MQHKMHKIEHFQNMLHDRTEFLRTASPVQLENFFDNNPHLKEVFIGDNGKLSHTLTYQAKVKLHGTYSGINIDFKKNKVFPQSRERQLTQAKPDSYGFYNWITNALDSDEFARNLKNDLEKSDLWSFSNQMGGIQNFVIHGEWAGPNVYYGVSSGLVEEDFYAVFAIELFTDHPESCLVITDPWEIRKLLDTKAKTLTNNPSDKVECHYAPFYILPYYKVVKSGSLTEWVKTVDLYNELSLEEFTAECNSIVDEIGKEDPFIKCNFGITGVGEGLVFYPCSVQKHNQNQVKLEKRSTIGSNQVFNYMFKAKNKAHQSIKTAKPVIITPEQQESMKKFVVNTCTDERLNQFFMKLDQPPTQKMMGEFLKSFGRDVANECRLEIEQFGDNKKLVMKKVNEKAANWFKSKINLR